MRTNLVCRVRVGVRLLQRRFLRTARVRHREPAPFTAKKLELEFSALVRGPSSVDRSRLSLASSGIRDGREQKTTHGAFTCVDKSL